jgi:hypothetical protein
MKIQFLYKYINISIILIILFSLVSCEEVIKLEPENSEPQIVIESVITDENGTFKVLISKSQDFYNDTVYKTINSAIVIISDNNGFLDTLSNNGNGIYSCNSLTGISGNIYKLEVVYNNVTYKASTILPLKTEITDLGYEWVENPTASGYLVNVYFNDNPDIKNYYRVKVFVNNAKGTNQKVGLEYLLYDDKIFNGEKTKLPALRGSKLLNVNDIVTVELYSLSKETYDYYNTLQNIIAVNRSTLGKAQTMIEGSSAPANPITNFDNNALGYFGAYCISRKTIVIK